MSLAERGNILRRLLDGVCEPSRIAAELRSYPWDSDDELVSLDSRHIRAVLDRFLMGEVDAAWLESWANAIESRDDIGYQEQHENLLSQLISEIANPELYGTLTIERVESIRALIP